jgi:hypothetical protein
MRRRKRQRQTKRRRELGLARVVIRERGATKGGLLRALHGELCPRQAWETLRVADEDGGGIIEVNDLPARPFT